MTTAIGKQIAARLRATQLNPSTAEKNAGLAKGVLWNILRGKSRKPTAANLQAIAGILECNITDLLTDQGLFQDDTSQQAEHKILEQPFQHPTLLAETVNLINARLKKRKQEISLSRLFALLEDTLLHGISTKSTQPSVDYIDWYLNRIAEST